MVPKQISLLLEHFNFLLQLGVLILEILIILLDQHQFLLNGPNFFLQFIVNFRESVKLSSNKFDLVL